MGVKYLCLVVIQSIPKQKNGECKNMLFADRLRIKKLLNQIADRKEYLIDFWRTSFYRFYFPFMPDWDLSAELANDKYLNQLYFEADKLCPVDTNNDIPISWLTLA